MDLRKIELKPVRYYRVNLEEKWDFAQKPQNCPKNLKNLKCMSKSHYYHGCFCEKTKVGYYRVALREKC